MDERILFLDTETGGVDPANSSLLSIGLAYWHNGKIEDTCELLLQEYRTKPLKNYALKINKINILEHNLHALKSEDAKDELLNFLTKNFPLSQPIVIAGHNIRFDIGFLKYFLKKHKIKFEPLFSHRSIDTASIMFFLYYSGKISEKFTSSDQAFRYFNIDIPQRHTALADAIAAAKLFNAQIEFIKEDHSIYSI